MNARVMRTLGAPAMDASRCNGLGRHGLAGCRRFTGSGRIGKAAGVEAKRQPDGTVKIAWSRTDVPVTVDGMRLPPAAGLGSWAALAPMGNRALVMGDTVVFQDEVDAAMDAAFAHGLKVTALHNHFFYDQPKMYFMHIAGEGAPQALAADVKAVWDAIKVVRTARAQPAEGFGGALFNAGKLDAVALQKIIGHKAEVAGDVAKITIGRSGHMHGQSGRLPGPHYLGCLQWQRRDGVHGW